MTQILGIVLVKTLITYSPSDSTPVKDCQVHNVPFVPSNKWRGAPRDGQGQCAGCDRL